MTLLKQKNEVRMTFSFALCIVETDLFASQKSPAVKITHAEIAY